MNRKSFFTTLIGSIFGGKMLANSELTPEPPKPIELVANSIVLKNNNGDSFILSVCEKGNLTIKETGHDMDRMTVVHSKHNHWKPFQFRA